MAHAALPVFTVNGSIIGESDNVKYLGHVICNDMSDDDMMRQRRHLVLRAMFYRGVSICVHLKLVVYYSVLFALPCITVSYGLDTLPTVYISCMLHTTMPLG